MNRVVCAGAAVLWLVGAAGAWAGGAACPSSVEPPRTGERTMETELAVGAEPGDPTPRPGGLPAEVATFALG